MLLEPLVYWVPWLKDSIQRQRDQAPTSPAMLCSKQFCVCLKSPKVFPEGRLCSFFLPPLAASKSHEAISSVSGLTPLTKVSSSFQEDRQGSDAVPLLYLPPLRPYSQLILPALPSRALDIWPTQHKTMHISDDNGCKAKKDLKEKFFLTSLLEYNCFTMVC